METTTESTTRNTHGQDRIDTDLPEGVKRRGAVLPFLCPLTTAFPVSFYFTWQRSRGTSLLVPFSSSALLPSPALSDPTLGKNTTSHLPRQTDRQTLLMLGNPSLALLHPQSLPQASTKFPADWPF